MQGVGLYVVVKPSAGIMRTSSSGLDIPIAMNDRFVQGEIISASEKEGKEDYGLEKGQIVLFDKYAGSEFKGVDNVTYKLVGCRDISVIL